MTQTDEFKILHDKIKAHPNQNSLDRMAAKIPVLSSGELEKYEYFTGEDLRYKLGAFEQEKFEHSPLGKVFDKELK